MYIEGHPIPIRIKWIWSLSAMCKYHPSIGGGNAAIASAITDMPDSLLLQLSLMMSPLSARRIMN